MVLPLQHNRGKLTGRHQWIFGGICRQSREIFLAICQGNKRDRPTLEEIIVRHVEIGTTLYTGDVNFQIQAMFVHEKHLHKKRNGTKKK